MTDELREVETTLKTNVGYVGDMLAALREVDPMRRLEVAVDVLGLHTRHLVIDEITIAEDGQVVFHVGPRS